MMQLNFAYSQPAALYLHNLIHWHCWNKLHTIL